MKPAPTDNFCQCEHCRRYRFRIFGGTAPGEPLTRESESYLMRSVMRDISLNRHPARLSVRWVRSGKYVYEINGRRYVLRPGNFLLVGDGEIYNSASDPKKISECLTVSFNPAVLSSVLGGMNEKPAALLDRPFERPGAGSDFLTDVYTPPPELKKLLDELSVRAAGAGFQQTGLDEAFYQLMAQLAVLQKQSRAEIGSIGAAKLATREELYRRLRRARDFIRDNADADLKIDDLAAVACLSPFHFLRSYKQAFGRTPHRELLDARLEKARRLMSVERNNFTLGRIAIECGFNDLSAFSKAFRQKFKVSPSLFSPAAQPRE